MRTVFGGVYRQENNPLVTYTIIGLCVLAFIGEWIPQLNLVNNWVMIPAYIAAKPWTLLTNIFLHSPSNILHIGLNMYVLWIMGQALEPMLGRLRYAISYLICGLGGSVGVVLFANPSSQSWMTSTLGASGAIFGLFGMMLILQRRLGIDIKQIIILIAINLVFGFMVSGISWQAHLVGLLTGLVLGGIMAYAPKSKQNFYQLGGTLLVTILLLVAVFLKVNTVTTTGV
ncbi:MAG: rhomboid family intramembrane serine protease [Micrococcaceae bacterium]